MSIAPAAARWEALMSALTRHKWLMAAGMIWLLGGVFAVGHSQATSFKSGKANAQDDDERNRQDPLSNAAAKAKRGRQVFRFDTFGDEAFWGGKLKLHQAIEGAALGGVGGGVSPATALAAGLKIDIDALPDQVREPLVRGRLNLNDPAVTVALLRLNAVIGLTGVFNRGGSLQSVGIQCSLCHSTVDDSAPRLCF